MDPGSLHKAQMYLFGLYLCIYGKGHVTHNASKVRIGARAILRFAKSRALEF